jgi:hypothetical protein
MAKENKRTGMRTCKYLDGDKLCTKYAQWKEGNKGCYCHKHFRSMELKKGEGGSAIVMTEANINSIAITDISQHASTNEQQPPQIMVTTNDNRAQEESTVPQPNINEDNVDVSFIHSVASTNDERGMNDNIEKIVKKLLKNRDKEVNALKRKLTKLDNECSALKKNNEQILVLSDGLSNVLNKYITQHKRDG